jgi:hypothetical protein
MYKMKHKEILLIFESFEESFEKTTKAKVCFHYEF